MSDFGRAILTIAGRLGASVEWAGETSVPAGKPVTIYHPHAILPRTGYGRVVLAIAADLADRGYTPALFADPPPAGFGPLSARQAAWLAAAVLPGAPVIQVTNPRNGTITRSAIVVTMWETDRISSAQVEALNTARAVVVPTCWGRDTFEASGVTVPIHVAPLAIDPAFRATGPPPIDPVVFGVAGRTTHGGVRKGLEDAAAAFLAALPEMPGARLKVKCWADCPDTLPAHPAIEVNRESMTAAALADWYRSLSVYISASRGEGWGLQTHEAMACGRPAIVVPWSGTLAYWDDACGWPIAFDLEPAGGVYADCGRWAVPRLESLRAALVTAYRHPDQVATRGARAAVNADRYRSWGRLGAVLVDLIESP